MPSKKVGEISI